MLDVLNPIQIVVSVENHHRPLVEFPMRHKEMGQVLKNKDNQSMKIFISTSDLVSFFPYLSIKRSIFLLRKTQQGSKEGRRELTIVLILLEERPLLVEIGVDVCCFRLFSLILPGLILIRDRNRIKVERKSSMI